MNIKLEKRHWYLFTGWMTGYIVCSLDGMQSLGRAAIAILIVSIVWTIPKFIFDKDKLRRK